MKKRVRRPEAARQGSRHGMSLIEVVMAVSVVAMASAAAVVALVRPSDRAKAAVCELQKTRIEAEARSMQQMTGTWPTVPELLRDRKRFPERTFTCPLDQQPYRLNPVDHRVHGHDH